MLVDALTNDLQRADLERSRRHGFRTDALDVEILHLQRVSGLRAHERWLGAVAWVYVSVCEATWVRRARFNLDFAARTLWALRHGQTICSVCREEAHRTVWCDSCGLIACAACCTTVHEGYLLIFDHQAGRDLSPLAYSCCAACLYLGLHRRIGWRYRHGKLLPRARRPKESSFWALYRAWCFVVEKARATSLLPWPLWYYRVVTNLRLPDFTGAQTRERLPHAPL